MQAKIELLESQIREINGTLGQQAVCIQAILQANPNLTAYQPFLNQHHNHQWQGIHQNPIETSKKNHIFTITPNTLSKPIQTHHTLKSLVQFNQNLQTISHQIRRPEQLSTILGTIHKDSSSYRNELQRTVEEQTNDYNKLLS